MPDIVLQNKLTELFFLFPEYIDANHRASAPYIHDMTYHFDAVQPSFVDNVIRLLTFFSYERNVTKYYDKKNLDGMLYPYQELEYPFVDTQVRTTLRDLDVVDWRIELGEDDTIIEWHGTQIPNDTVAKVYERAHTDTPDLLVHATLFSVGDAIENDGETIVFKKENVDCSLSYQTTLRGLHEWLSENRIPQRYFKYSEKHGENGVGGWMLPNNVPAAVLECNREHAQEILCKAIGDTSLDNDLWYFDADYDKVLYFEYENQSPQNEYHGYHLSQGDKGYSKVKFDLLRLIQDIPNNH